MKKMLAVILSLMLACAALGAAAETAPAAAESAPATEIAPLFATVAEALEKGEPTGCATITDKVYVTVVRYNDRWIRLAASMDEETSAQYEALLNTDDYENIDARMGALFAPLPVLYTEDLTGAALSQAELDALAGKTIAELTANGFEITSYGTAGDGNNKKALFGMARGLFEYEAVPNVSPDEFEKLCEDENFKDLTVSSASLLGISYNAADLSWHADGTYEAPAYEADPLSTLFEGLSGLWNSAAENGEAALEEGETKLNDLLQSLGGTLSEAGEKGETKLNELLKSLTEAGEDGKTKVTELLESLGGALSEAGENGEAALNELIKSLTEAGEDGKTKLDEFLKSLTEVGENGKTKLDELLESLGGALSEAGAKGEAKLDELLKLLKEKEPELKDGFSSMLDSFLGMFNK